MAASFLLKISQMIGTAVRTLIYIVDIASYPFSCLLGILADSGFLWSPGLGRWTQDVFGGLYRDLRLFGILRDIFCPPLNSGSQAAILSLIDHLEAAERAVRGDVFLSLLVKDYNINLESDCSTQTVNRPRPLHLLVSSVGGASSSRSSGQENEDEQETEDEQENEDEQPLGEVLYNHARSILFRPQYSHWAIITPGRRYELVVPDTDERAGDAANNIEIRSQDNPVNPRGNSAMPGSQESETQRLLHPESPTGGQERPAAKSQPRVLEFELGSTYLDEDDIGEIIEMEVHRRRKNGEMEYNAGRNNCQTLWTNGILNLILCQCPNQNLRERPDSVGEWSLDHGWSMAQAYLLATGFICLGKRGYVMYPGPWVPWSNRWFFLFWEMSGILDSVWFLCSFAASPVRSGFSRVFAARTDAVQTNGAAEIFKRQLSNATTGSRELRLLRWVQATSHAALMVHTVVGWLWRSAPSPSVLELADLGIGALSCCCIAGIRKFRFQKGRFGPPCCIAGLFGRLRDEDETVWKAAIPAYVQTLSWRSSTQSLD